MSVSVKGNRVLPQERTDRLSSNTFFPVLCERGIYQLRGGTPPRTGWGGVCPTNLCPTYGNIWFHLTKYDRLRSQAQNTKPPLLNEGFRGVGATGFEPVTPAL